MLTAAVAYGLSAAGLVVAGLAVHRRRYLSATRWFAVALLPAGLYLTGLYPVARTIGQEIADWATALVFDPRVWTGIVLLVVSAVLLLGCHRVARRRLGEERGAARPAAPGAGPERPAVTGARPPASRGPKATGGADDGLGDFADVEEILRKRGI
ncbi:hypothetical protein [Kitasatospora sp. NPDC057015]|uniref:hypothetical protein n=1 Tax=Kitasatospora sp. NPDC057015 TaxID=3346001 RepID=UPI0036412B6C